VVGFGSTEKAKEEAIIDQITDWWTSRFGDDPNFDGFEEDPVKEFTVWLEGLEREHEAAAAKYKDAAEFPGRYSTFHCRVAYNYYDLMVVLKFMHTNRHHALSPDGCAAMRTKRIHHIDYFDWKYK
jgi:SpoVK/Ycf46/Vps4 family AAA+-type ATPase